MVDKIRRHHQQQLNLVRDSLVTRKADYFESFKLRERILSPHSINFNERISQDRTFYISNSLRCHTVTYRCTHPFPNVIIKMISYFL